MVKKLKCLIYLFYVILINVIIMSSQSYVDATRQLSELWISLSNNAISDNDSDRQLELLMNRLQDMVQLRRFERTASIEESQRRLMDFSVRYLRPVVLQPGGQVNAQQVVQPPPVRRRRAINRRRVTPDVIQEEPVRRRGRGRRPIIIDDDEPEIDVMPYRIKIKTVSKEINDQPCQDACPICMDIHTKSECIKTECEHEFGKRCFQSWMTAATSNKKCPSCRMECSVVTMYKSKKEKTPIIEDNVIVIV